MHFLLFVFIVLIAAPVQAQTAVDGYKAYDAGDYETAKAIILPLAEQGDPIAMNAMGNWHADGILVEKSRKLACDWYEKAANAGYVSAQNNFAYCFHGSGGRKRSIKQYLFWMTKSGQQSNLNAQLELMFWYMNTNKELAKKWGELAAAQNSTVARVALWISNMDNNISPVMFSEIVCVFYNNSLLKRSWTTCDD
ncbi:tetratricopeptide repeat protein [Terasakiella pusilla]|uniref:tetratricopeptide repeat protein n=1 Tax=Terasakiella pusilla TaxID=64973 RepID=UPI003AA87C00